MNINVAKLTTLASLGALAAVFYGVAAHAQQNQGLKIGSVTVEPGHEMPDGSIFVRAQEVRGKLELLLMTRESAVRIYTFSDAKDYCVKLGDGWRLPKEDEAHALHPLATGVLKKEFEPGKDDADAWLDWYWTDEVERTVRGLQHGRWQASTDAYTFEANESNAYMDPLEGVMALAHCVKTKTVPKPKG